LDEVLQWVVQTPEEFHEWVRTDFPAELAHAPAEYDTDDKLVAAIVKLVKKLQVSDPVESARHPSHLGEYVRTIAWVARRTHSQIRRRLLRLLDAELRAVMEEMQTPPEPFPQSADPAASVNRTADLLKRNFFGLKKLATYGMALTSILQVDTRGGERQYLTQLEELTRQYMEELPRAQNRFQWYLMISNPEIVRIMDPF